MIKEKAKQKVVINSDYNDISNLIPAEDKFDLIDADDNYLKKLCSQEEKVIIEFKKQGFNGKEIANKLGCSTSKINCCLHNVRQKIREYQREM